MCLKGEETNGVSLRLPAAFIAEADELVSTLQATAEARAAGGHWGRSGVLRLAVGEGLRVLGSKGISSTDPTGDEVLTAVCMWLRNRANNLDNNGSYTLPNNLLTNARTFTTACPLTHSLSSALATPTGTNRPIAA